MDIKNKQIQQQEMDIQEFPIVVGLDIGTTKTVIMVAQKTINNKIEIIGFGRSEADRGAVKGGEVINVHDTAFSIKKALEACDTHCRENNIDLKIEDVYVGISGKHIKTTSTHDNIIRKNPNTTVTKEEIFEFIESQYKMYVPNNTKIVDVIPSNFEVDQRPVKKVEGTCGIRLGANFHIITADEDAMRMINLSVEQAGLKTVDFVLQPLASSNAVLSPYDMEINVAIVDIGGGTTDITVFNEGEIYHTAVIPIGGTNFTHDIHRGLKLSLYEQAEEIKKRHGGVLPEMIDSNKYIVIPALKPLLPKKEIKIKVLAEIMKERALILLETIYQELYSVGLSDNSLSCIILTGGGSQLQHLKELAEFKFGVPVHIGIPDEHLATGHIDQFKDPSYATCIGLLLEGFKDDEKKSMFINKTSTQQEDQIATTPLVDNGEKQQRKPFFSLSEKLNQLIKKGILNTFGDGDISNKSF
ncbi:MAG: cell division protein FtsA [Chitinophagaceae bacterium]